MLHKWSDAIFIHWLSFLKEVTMAIPIAQVWKEIIIYFMSTLKAQNGPQKIPFSFNIFMFREYTLC